MIDATQLDAALRAAGVPIDGCSSEGRVDFQGSATAAQRQQAEAIIAAHRANPPPPIKQQRAADYASLRSLEDRVAYLAKFLGLA